MNNLELTNLVLEVIIFCTALPVVFSRDERIKKKAIWALTVACSVFAAFVLTGAVNKRGKESRAMTVMDLTQVDMSMRIDAVTKQMTSASPTAQVSLPDTALKMLAKARAKAPDDAAVPFHVGVLEGELGRKLDDTLKTLSTSRDKKATRYAKLLEDVYVKRKVAPSAVETTRQEARSLVKTGWFKDIIDIEILRAGGKKEEADRALKLYNDHNSGFAWRMVFIGACAILSFLAGIVVIFCQLFVLSRNPQGESEKAELVSPVDWGLLTVYGVFVGWLTLEGIIGQLMAATLHPISGASGAVVPLVTMAIYLLTNGPALLLIWLLAVKPAKLKYFESVKLRFRTSSKGPFALVFTGILTWFACVPLVVLSAIPNILTRSEGSSNPILSVIMNSVQSADLLTGLLFIFAVGVLPGVCEEILFRGFLYSYLRRRLNAPISMLISSILFAGIHLDGGAFPQLFVLGMVFAFVTERNRSIVPSIIAHAMWNSGTFSIMLLLFGK